MHLTHTYTQIRTQILTRAPRVCNGGERAAFMQIRACARGKFLIQFGFACAYTPGYLTVVNCIGEIRPVVQRPRNNCAAYRRPASALVFLSSRINTSHCRPSLTGHYTPDNLSYCAAALINSRRHSKYRASRKGSRLATNLKIRNYKTDDIILI